MARRHKRKSSGLKSVSAKILVPAFVCLGLALGGASQEAFILHGGLQVLAAIVLIACVVPGRLQPFPRQARIGLLLGFLFLLLFAAQLFPLPPALWTGLPGREGLLAGFETMDMRAPTLPISMAPQKTLAALLHFLPALAVFVLIARQKWRTSTAYLPWVLAMIAVISIGLGVFQVYGRSGDASYLYDRTNPGVPVGLFANGNHQATLLLMVLPFIGALIGRNRAEWGQGERDYTQVLALAPLGFFLLFGVLIAGSVAGYVLLVISLSGAVVIARNRAQRGYDILGIALVCGLALVAVATVFASPRIGGFATTALFGGEFSRSVIWSGSLQLFSDYWLTGVGLGAYPDAFGVIDSQNALTAKFVNHAHNDWLEFLLDTGISGAVLLILFLIWFANLFAKAWSTTTQEGARLQRAASIGLLIIMLHSFVDYPLRTPGLSILAAAFLGIMAMDVSKLSKSSGTRKREPRPVAEPSKRLRASI